MAQFKSFIFFISIQFVLFSEPYVHFDAYKSVVILSPCRTGSTRVFNVLNYLCREGNYETGFAQTNNVGRFHENFVLDQDSVVFATIRHPYEAAISYCNLHDIRIVRDARERMLRLKKQYDSIKQVIDGGKYLVTVLRYEKFNDDFSYLFHEIENRIGDSISDEEKEEIKQRFCFKRMKEICDAISPHRYFDRETWMVKGHIGKKRNGFVKSRPFKRLLKEYLSETCKDWGYDCNEI